MELSLMRENIQTEQPTGICRSQAAVEGEVTLPGGLREETRVLSADAMAVVESAESMQDRVSMAGRVVFHCLYTQGDPEKINCIEAAADFRHLCDLPGAKPRDTVLALAQVEHVEATVLNGRLKLRAVVHLQGKSVAVCAVEALTDVACSVSVQRQTKQSTLRRTVAMGSTDVLLREEFDLPQDADVRDTLYGTASVQTGEVTGGLGRIGVNGQVLLEVIHATGDPARPLVTTRHSIPLEQTVELSGESGELLDARVTVKDVAVASQDMGDGTRTLRAEVLLGVQGWADREETITTLSDAYTVSGDDLRLRYTAVRCRTGSRRQQCAESGKTMLLLPESAAPVRRVLAAFATPVMTAREQLGGRLTVEGMLETTLLYLTDDSAVPVAVFRAEPFRTTFAAQAGEDDLLTIAVTEADAAAITSDRVELRYILRLGIEGTQSEEIRFVTDAQPVASAEPEDGIVLYFTQPGESLWEIARRYRVPAEEIRTLNPELTGEPQAGQGVVIWRRCQDRACV